MQNFKQTNLDTNILKGLSEMGFETPTSIQAKTIPHLMNSNLDLIATAQTGTGKTAAFGLPSIHLTNLKYNDTQTLVLCPTRELCIQISKDLAKYSKYVNGLNILAVYGGSNINTQIKSLNKGAHIVVGTPGRTKDLIKRKKLNIGRIARIILDEADAMTDESQFALRRIIEENSLVVTIEAGSIMSWQKYIGNKGMNFGIDRFGESAPYKEVYKHFKLSEEDITNFIQKKLRE